jgi:hypothetical protein
VDTRLTVLVAAVTLPQAALAVAALDKDATAAVAAAATPVVMVDGSPVVAGPTMQEPNRFP